MAILDQDDAVVVSGVLTLSGTAGSDEITINGDYSDPGATSGLIDGGGGADVLRLNAATLSGTTITGIEETQLLGGFTTDIDADILDDLGTVTTGGNARGRLRLFETDGQDVALTTSLEDGQRLIVTMYSGATDENFALDFSSGSFLGDSGVDFVGSLGNETVTGGSGNDDLDGEGGNDTLIGGEGDDRLTAGGGTDNLSGDAGNDLLESFGIQTGGTLSGDAGDDDFDMRGVFDGGGTISGGDGYDTLLLNAVDIKDTTVTGIEESQLIGGFTTDIDADILDDLGTVTTGGNARGRLRLFDTDGQDAVLTAALEDGQKLIVTMYSGAAGENFSIDFSSGSFAGDSGVDFTGSIGNETVTGGSGNDTIDLGSGDDTLIGSAGSDLMAGGFGADSFAFTAFQDDNTVEDFTVGEDQLVIYGAPAGFGLAQLAAFAGQAGDDIVVSGMGTTITILDVQLSEVSPDDVLIL